MKKKAKIKKAYFLIILFIMSIYYSYKYFENKNKTLNNKEIVELVVNNSFKEENIIKQLINYNSNPIRLLNKTYEETIEEKTDKPVIYLYNTHPKEEYNKSTIGEYSINPTVIMNNYILEDIFEKKGFPSFVEEKETTETVELGTFGGDINNDFLAAMEENLVASKNKRLGSEEEPEPEAKKAPAKKTTTKKTTTKKEAEKKEPAKKEAAKKETTAKKTTTTKKTTKK